MIDQHKFSCLEQGSPEWLKARLGYFSGSQVGLLMKSGRAKDQVFSDTAMGYIFEVAGKRRILPAFLDDEEGWMEYTSRTQLSGRAIQWGKDFEPYARQEYEQRNDCEVNECGFVIDAEIEYFGDSPDGIISNDKGQPIGALEIKCPDSKTYVKYEYELITLGKSLKDVNPEYYWQCLCHISVNNLLWADFVAYDPMLKYGYLQVRIFLNEVEDDIRLMRERVLLANEQVNNINNNVRQ